VALVAGLVGVTAVACENEPDRAAFSISETEILAAAAGTSANVTVTSDDEWIATTNVPWVAVSPVNGRGTVDCQVRVDTTGMHGGSRRGTVRFESVKNGTSLSLNVEQVGYERFISVAESTIDVPEYAETNKRTFDLEVTANVPFTINSADGGNWITHDDYNFELDRGARPRKVKIRFRYLNNTVPNKRECKITFTAANTPDAEVMVSQKQAPPIEDSRQGDSLAIVAIARAIKYNMGDNEGKSMDKWSFVRLWNPEDEGYTPELKGRLRYVNFYLFATWLNVNDFSKSDQLPYELGYLKTVEELVLYANSNYLLVSLGTGQIGKLTRLKKLTMYAVGLNRLDMSTETPEINFTNLRNLEYLDLSGNNLTEVPDILTPANFPNLKHLDLGNNIRYTVIDLSNTPRAQAEWGGLYGQGSFPAQLLKWDNLEYLSLGNNYIHGTLPDMNGYTKYTAGDEYISARGDTIVGAVGLPRVWPKMKVLRINLNHLKGDLPEWLLYHPNLDTWDPQVLVFKQQSNNMKDVNGQVSGFSNVPQSDDYFYERYPLLNPVP
jgi:hypothetical protein